MTEGCTFNTLNRTKQEPNAISILWASVCKPFRHTSEIPVSGQSGAEQHVVLHR